MSDSCATSFGKYLNKTNIYLSAIYRDDILG